MKKLCVALVAVVALSVAASCRPVKKQPTKTPPPTTTTQPQYPPSS